jgi:hypothetical protein
MKKLFLWFICCAGGLPLFGQTPQPAPGTQLAPGAQAQIDSLLGKPAMVKPAEASPLGKNWFRLETDAHVFTDQVSVKQVGAVMLDLDHQDTIYNGKKSKLTAQIVSRSAAEAIVDFVSVSVGPFNIQIKTPYRASVKTAENTDTKIIVEVRQLDSDSASNNDIKNLFATRYAEEVVINGKKYTYIRVYTIDEVNASFLPGAKGALESSSGPVNEEGLQMIINAARNR